MTASKTAKKKFTVTLAAATSAETSTNTPAHAPLIPSDKQGVQSSTQSGTTFKYQFPPPSKEIIDNVAKSLLDVPELYQNVLNIMNKMALPPPFVEKPASQFNDASSSKTFASGSNANTQPIASVSVDNGKGVDRVTKVIASSLSPKATVSAVLSSKTGPAMASAETNSSSKSAKTKARKAPLSLKDQQEEINATAASCLTASRATASTLKASTTTGTKSTPVTTPSSALSSKNSASSTASPQASLSFTSTTMPSNVPKPAAKASPKKKKTSKGKKAMLPAGKTSGVQTTTCSKGQRKRRKQKEKRAAEIVRKMTFGLNRFATSPLLSGESFAFPTADTMEPQLPLGSCGQALDGMKLQRELLIRNSFLNENFALETAAHLQRELAKHKSAMATATTPKERTYANILMNNTEFMTAYHEYNVSQMAEFLKVKNPLKKQPMVKEQASSADGTVDVAESTSSTSSTSVLATTWNKENVSTTASAPPNPKLFSIDTAPSSLPPATVIQGNTDAATLRLPSFVVSSIDIAPSAPVVGPSTPPLPGKLTTPTKPILRTVSQFEDIILPSEPYILTPSLAGGLPLKRKAGVLSLPSAPDSEAAQNTTTLRKVGKNEGDPDYVLSSNESGGESKPKSDSEPGPGLEIDSESQPKDDTDAEAVNRAQPRQRLSWGVEWIKEIPKDAILSPELTDTTEKMDTEEESATDPMDVVDATDEAEEIKATDVAKGNMATDVAKGNMAADTVDKIKAAVSAEGVKAADLAMVLKSTDPISGEAFNDIEPTLEQMTKKQQTEIRQVFKDHKKDEKKAFWLEVNDPVVPVPLAMIDSNRVPQDELLSNPKIHYIKSEPSPTLFINNLIAKRVRAQDLANIFSNFFDPPKDIEVKGTIRYMNAGRMKGRAYIYFPNVEKAKEARERVNGYILHGQPMVIMYGNQPQNTQKNAHNASDQDVGRGKRQASGNGDVIAKVKDTQKETVFKK
ncbi:hypothetical protein BG011_009711 [Mortierella polycephala]|uniref:RRM domain-containing protein n=1 Tax=Mortierella polycephala TaxID=41804 RepID=A0A9P6U7C3_9FUNG|nr:hypothetical protein BG011_009711 [Mortierella polycephala]